MSLTVNKGLEIQPLICYDRRQQPEIIGCPEDGREDRCNILPMESNHLGFP